MPLCCTTPSTCTPHRTEGCRYCLLAVWPIHQRETVHMAKTCTSSVLALRYETAHWSHISAAHTSSNSLLKVRFRGHLKYQVPRIFPSTMTVVKSATRQRVQCTVQKSAYNTLIHCFPLASVKTSGWPYNTPWIKTCTQQITEQHQYLNMFAIFCRRTQFWVSWFIITSHLNSAKDMDEST